MGFILHFYIIFGTNLLTGGPAQIAVFCQFQCFAEKEYQTESKRNETLGNVSFGTNVIHRTWSGRQSINEAATRGRGRPYPPRRALHPHGPLVAPPTYFFLVQILTYPENIQEHHETLFPPPTQEIPFWGRQNSDRGSRTVHLGRMVTGGRGHDVLPRFGPS